MEENMDDRSLTILARVSLIEVSLGMVFLFVLGLAGLGSLLLMFFTPVIPLVFLVVTAMFGAEFSWKPSGWRTLLIANLMLFIWFGWYFWINDPINHSAWH